MRKMLKTKKIHLAEFHKMIEAHKQSHDPENPRDLIDSYLTRMKEERKIIPDTTFTGTELFLGIVYRLEFLNTQWSCLSNSGQKLYKTLP